MFCFKVGTQIFPIRDFTTVQQQENYKTKISKISHMQNTVGHQQELVVILARSNIT